MAGNKKNPRKRKIKRVDNPVASFKFVDRIREDFFRLEAGILMKLHKGEMDLEDLVVTRAYFYGAQFILLRRAEQFSNLPVNEWVELIESGVEHLTESIHRTANHAKTEVVCTAEELKAITNSAVEVFPFLHDCMTSAPRTTAFDILACAQLMKDTAEVRMATSLLANRDEKKFETYYNSIAKRFNTGELYKEARGIQRRNHSL